jgi:dihydroorotase
LPNQEKNIDPRDRFSPRCCIRAVKSLLSSAHARGKEVEKACFRAYRRSMSSAAALRLELPYWYDLHAHFRQGELTAHLIGDHLRMGCAGILAMPNTKPPVSRVLERDAGDGWSVESYLSDLAKAGGDAFLDIIVPLYLTAATTPEMIAAGAKAGLLRAAKYYPPHGTTGAEFGAPLETFIQNEVFKAMEEHGVVLCIHGEEHGLSGERYFGRRENAEETFYRERMPQLVEKYPKLKIVCEHVTTKAAVDFVKGAPANVAATITPQHLIYTVGNLVQGLKYHLYCLPLVKFDEDREALRAAAVSGNAKFFAGTDSAPHAKKMTECGCAAGCYTGGIAPQIYAQAFEMAGADLGGRDFENFKKFLCMNGPEFYNLKKSSETFTMEKQAQEISVLKTGVGEIVPLPVGMHDGKTATLPWRIA